MKRAAANGVLLAASGLLAITANSAFGQTAPASTALNAPAVPAAIATDDIVVTARKKSETAHDVPASISVISGASLLKQNITSVSDLGQAFAGVVVNNAPNSSSSITVRGLGTPSASFGFDQSISLFVDGIYAGRSRDYVTALFDASRVELLKGTETAVLGKNTSLGAISVVSREPGRDLAYNGNISHEFQLKSNVVGLGVDVPVSDTLAMRFAGQYSDLGGWIHNIYKGGKYPTDHSFSGRVTTVWRPTTDLKIKLIYQHDDAIDKGSQFVWGGGGNGSAAAVAADYGVILPIGRTTTQVDDGTTRDDYNGNRVTLDAELQLGRYSLQSLTGYSEYQDAQIFENDSLPGNLAQQYIKSSNKQISQEIRLNSPTNMPFDYMVGASYLHGSFFYGQTAVGYAPWVQTGSYYGLFAQKTDSVSGFGQANLHLSNRFTVSGGLRYTNETKQALIARTTLVAGTLINGNKPIPETGLSRTEDDLDGSVDAEFKINPDMMLYASWAKGTKGGGFQNAPSNIGVAEYAKEVARTYEAGAKFNFHHLGYLNVAAYNTDVAGFQSVVFVPPIFVVTSLPLRSRGFELESKLSPVRNLTFNGAVTYADVIDKANQLPVRSAPKWSGNASVEYLAPIDTRFNLIGNVGVDFRSAMYLQSLPSIIPEEPGYAKLNARITFEPANDHWELSLIGKNLTDKKTYNYGYPQLYPGTYLLSPDRPLTVAIQFSFHY